MTTNNSDAYVSVESFEDIVIKNELEYISTRREQALKEHRQLLTNENKSEKDPDWNKYKLLLDDQRKEDDTVGLTFSGGGMRAMAFNLGIVQALSKAGILPWVDYLASVSGGGFTAAALTTLLSKKSEKKDALFNTHWKKFPFNPEVKVFDPKSTETLGPENPDDDAELYKSVSDKKGINNQLGHMRQEGDFLTPRQGLVTRDMLRAYGAILSGMGVMIVTFLLVLVAIASFHYFVTASLAPALLLNNLAASQEPDEQTVEGQSVQADNEDEVASIAPLAETCTNDSSYTLLDLVFRTLPDSPCPIADEEAIEIPGWRYASSFGMGVLFSIIGFYFIVLPLYRDVDYIQSKDFKTISTRIKRPFYFAFSLLLLVSLGLILAYTFSFLAYQPPTDEPALTGYIRLNGLTWLGLPLSAFFVTLAAIMWTASRSDRYWDREALGRQEYVDAFVLTVLILQL